jgi:hypothetical protein
MARGVDSGVDSEDTMNENKHALTFRGANNLTVSLALIVRNSLVYNLLSVIASR